MKRARSVTRNPNRREDDFETADVSPEPSSPPSVGNAEEAEIELTKELERVGLVSEVEAVRSVDVEPEKMLEEVACAEVDAMEVKDMASQLRLDQRRTRSEGTLSRVLGVRSSRWSPLRENERAWEGGICEESEKRRTACGNSKHFAPLFDHKRGKGHRLYPRARRHRHTVSDPTAEDRTTTGERIPVSASPGGF